MNIATSADGYVARPDGNLNWLTERPAPKGFYGLPEFERSTDAKILGRKTFDRSLQMGARFSAAENCVPRSWLLTFTDSSDEVTAQCYLHASDYAPQGWDS